MDMEGKRVLHVTREQAWQALNDPEVLKACVPGCDRLEPTGDDQFAVGMAVKIGPVSAKFAGKLALSDIVPPSSYRLAFEGQGGAAGFGKGSAEVRLADHTEGCELTYTAQATVGGKIAQMGQRLIDGVAKSMAEDFFRRFDDELRRRHPLAEGAPAAAPAAEAPAGSALPYVIALLAGTAALVWLIK